MTLSLATVVLFAIVVLPGFVAQKSRHLAYPPSTLQRTVFGDLGEYMLDSVWIHAFVFAIFALALCWTNGLDAANALKSDLLLKPTRVFVASHSLLVIGYALATVIAAYLYGFFRAWQLTTQPLISRFSHALKVPLSMEEFALWYAVLGAAPKRRVYVEVCLKSSGDIYSGKLALFPVVPDSCDTKDFYITDVFFRNRDDSRSCNRRLSCGQLKCDGVLLNSSNVESIRVFYQEVETPPNICSRLRELFEKLQQPQ